MRVVCVKWGDKYGPEWVYNLQRMVSRHLSVPHEFVCMTDEPISGVDCVPCEPGLPSWWSKIGLFKPGKFPGLNLYLDLDVVITRNIDGILGEAWRGKLTARDDFSYSLLKPKQGLGDDMLRLLGGAGTIQSSVMLWHNDDAAAVWAQFTPEKIGEVHGDQNYITQVMWPDKIHLLDNAWACSYKYHILQGMPCLPICVFHGNPKVTELPGNHYLRAEWEA